LAGEHGNVIFAVNNLNVFNISNNSGDEDGQFTELYPITEDSNLNELLLESFNGNAYNLAKVIHYLGRKRLGLGNSLERDTWWVWNETSRKWARSTRSAGVFVSEDVANRYLQCREWFRQNTSDTKLRKVRMEKMNGVIRRLQDRDKQLILKQTAEIFEAKEESIEDKLDSNSYLLGFEGEVYDLSTGRVRLCEPEDYISLSVGYPFPHDIDEEVQGELGKILCEMQPNAEELDYLLKFLASTLNGSNSEEIFTIFTGNGRNGKSVLTDLMRFALSEKGYFHPLQASFLTHERPSSSKPCPDLLNLRGKRFACASEPEGEQKMNAGFVKLLTGNDLLTGSYKHSNEEIIFRGQHSLVLLCNGIPAMDAKDEALWMRSRVVEFPVHFVDNPTGKNQRQRDNSLKDKIPHWGPQFMRLLLRYYVRYQAEGLRPTEGVLRATGRVQKENDLFIEFIEGHFELSEADDDMLSKKEVNAAFVAWCSARGDGRILIAKKNTALGLLKKSMKKAGFNTFEEEDVNGKVIEQKKRVDTTYQVPAYGRIRKKEDH
jgi:P4 family phage/plasmid primase-like protien